MNELPGIKSAIEQFNLIGGESMQKPQFATVNTIIKSEDKIRDTIRGFEAQLQQAFKERITVIETKLRTVLDENEKLHHERLVMAREIQRLRAQRQRMLEVLEVKTTD